MNSRKKSHNFGFFSKISLTLNNTQTVSLGELFYPFTPGQPSHYLFSPQNSGFWTSERLCWPVRVEMVHYWFNILTLLRRPTKWSVQCMVRYCHSMGADLDEETKGFSFITFLLVHLLIYLLLSSVRGLLLFFLSISFFFIFFSSWIKKTKNIMQVFWCVLKKTPISCCTFMEVNVL